MSQSPRDRSRIALFEIMLLIAGLSVGLWIALPLFREVPPGAEPGARVLAVSSFLLGGLSLIGPPLLLWERRRRRTAFGAGQVMWFSQGMASWLLWPPIIYTRVRTDDMGRSMTAGCFLYGTPLMAVYMTTALLCGGWFRKRRRRAMMRSWSERFGLGLALVWACFGLYVLSIFYREDFRR